MSALISQRLNALPIRIVRGLAELELDPRTGAWKRAGFAGTAGVITSSAHIFEVYVEDKPVFGEERQTSSHRVEEAAGIVELKYERAGLTAVQRICVEEDRISQCVTLSCEAGDDRLLTEIRYTLPNFVVGDPEDCLLQLPGQILPPDSPYSAEARNPLDLSWADPHPVYPQGWLESAPDQTSGLIAVENRASGRIASAWLYSEDAVVFPTIDGNGHTITAAHRHRLTCWLRPGVSVVSGEHCLLLSKGSLEEHLARFRKAAYDSILYSVSDAPEWLHDARLLQIDARPLQIWMERLPHYREMGFNVLYLLPVWHNQRNPYALIDHYQIDDDTSRSAEWAAYPDGICPTWDDNPFPVGSEEDLRLFVEYARRLGFRVLFDLIPQGIGTGTAFSHDHADWLSVDELGRPRASHGWGPTAGEPASEKGTYSMDWGNPQYRRYIVEWALWNVRTFGIDGFRTDAMHWKEANLRRDLQRPAWHTTFGGVRLIEELRVELKREFPETVLLSEVWGPIFQRGHDATYENGWMLGRMNTGWLTGEPLLSGREWTRHLQLAKLARPEGLVRATFGANHDLELFVELAKSHPMADAVQFVHIFSAAVPFVWYKEVEGREETFRNLLAERERLSGWNCHYDGAVPASRHLYTALWHKSGASPLLAVANLSNEDVHTVVKLSREVGGLQPSGVRLHKGFTRVKPDVDGLNLELPAGGYALIELSKPIG
ncbi:alpha-amylase family protein [Cohnella abietis]|uniref:Glycosyl hydrolase family 13 catalytic domain-containing protein n=1 Tax=Cohnella abietis TaxID=2507935 RepID=A0A3T1CZC1_9BACL|nr:hypothetical protein [Cohnella abietis]BBI31168.1 hypothetical protein KCTCHS21_05670 [Cohnella abietis]